MKTQRLNQVISVAKNNIVEYGICLLTTIYACLINADVCDGQMGYLYFAPFFFILANIFNYYTLEKKLRWVYYAIGIVFIATFFCKPDVPDTMYAVALLIAFITYLIFKWPKDNVTFAKNTVEVATSANLALWISLGIYLLAIALKESIFYLFDIHGLPNFYSTLERMVVMSLFPAIFLSFQLRPLLINLKNKFFSSVFLYLLTPAFLLYTAILFIYFLKIAILWELPKGGVAMMVFGFTIAAFVLKLVYPLFETPKYRWLFRHIAYFILPALLVFWIGTMYRINEFGFTEARVYLCIGGIVLSASALLLLSQKAGRYLYFALILIALLFVFTFIPKISAKDIETYSQNARVELDDTIYQK